MKFSLIILGIFLQFGQLCFAQSPHQQLLDDKEGNAFYLIRDVLPKKKLTILTGQYSLGIFNDGPKYNEIVKNETSTLIEIDAKEVYQKLKDKNLLSIESEIKTLGIGIRLGKIGIGFQHSIVAFNHLTYSKELFGTLFIGNAQYIGKTVSLSPNLSSALYNSFGFGAGVEIGKTTLATRVNLLTGITGAQTFRSKLDLYTDPDYYQLKLNTDYEIGTSGLLNLDSLQSQNFLSLTNDYKVSDFFTSNFGVSIDFAAHSQINDKMSVGLGIRRLGYINFTKNANIYSSKKEIEYDGLDLGKFIQEDSVEVSGLLDSLTDLVKFDKNAKSFKIKLAPEIQLYTKYFITEKIGLYGSLYYSVLTNSSIYAASAGLNYKPVAFFNVGSNVTYLSGSSLNIGLHAMFNIWKLSIHLGSDNILTAVNPKNTNFTTAYVGVRWNL